MRLPSLPRRIGARCAALLTTCLVSTALAGARGAGDTLSPEAFGWLLAGGIFYTAGVPFYALDSRIPYFHPVWHMFVIAGSVCHYVTIFRFLL